jgi:hypothetical protein
MRLPAVLACAAALAIGCGKKEPEQALEPGRPAGSAFDASERGGSQHGARAPAAQGSARDGCREAVEHMLALLAGAGAATAVGDSVAASIIDACRNGGWSDEVIACLEGAKDVSALEACKLATAAGERSRAGMAPSIRGDAGAAPAGAPSSPATPEASTPSALELRVSGYAKLLAIDVSLFQMIEAYPGAPQGTTFETLNYQWRRQSWLSLDAMQKEVDAVLASTSATPTLTADAAVGAYAKQLAGWMPRLIALAAYYDDHRFVDDEFDRGRKESVDVRRTAAEVGRRRAPMRAAVFGAWRDLVAEYRATPRGGVAFAWMACMSVADRVMEKASPEAITRAVSECRRSIPKLTELAASSGFDRDVRSAAIELGDWVAQGYPTWRTSVGDRLGWLTLRYLELWPKLPAIPAERPAP